MEGVITNLQVKKAIWKFPGGDTSVARCLRAHGVTWSRSQAGVPMQLYFLVSLAHLGRGAAPGPLITFSTRLSVPG